MIGHLDRLTRVFQLLVGMNLGILIVLLACLFTGLPLQAAGGATDPSYLIIGVGAAQMLNQHKHFLYDASYRFKVNYLGLHPYVIGGSATDGAPLYLGAGLLYYLDLSSRLRITLSSGPGYYNHESSTRNLGYPNEFYSNIEVSTRVWDGHRLGLSFGHISNASASHHNPGYETLRLNYGIPFH